LLLSILIFLLLFPSVSLSLSSLLEVSGLLGLILGLFGVLLVLSLVSFSVFGVECLIEEVSGFFQGVPERVVEAVDHVLLDVLQGLLVGLAVLSADSLDHVQELLPVLALRVDVNERVE
jgi:hypothetical protein